MASPFPLHSTRTASVDALRQEHASALVQALGVVGFALLTALGAQVRVYVWEVPFTLQTVAVYGSGLFLGWRGGLLAQILYLALGLVLPVYAGGEMGPAYLFGAVSAGYLLAFPFAAALVGALSKGWNTLTGSVLCLLAGSLVIFAGGVAWLHVAADHATWAESVTKGWLRFIPVDLAKVLLVAFAYGGARRFSRKE